MPLYGQSGRPVLVSTPAMRLGLVVARLRRRAARDGVFYDPERAARDVARAMMGLPGPAMMGRVSWRDVWVEVKARRAVAAFQLEQLGMLARAGGFTGIVLVGPVDPLIADFVMTPDGRRVPLVQLSVTRGVRP